MGLRRTRRTKAAAAGGGGHGGASGRWLVSYADFITLMFVVFLVLFSTANVDAGKYGMLKASLQSSSIGGPVQPLPVGGNPVNTAPLAPGPDPESYAGAPKPKPGEEAKPAPPPPAVVAPAVDPKSTVMKPGTEPETKPAVEPPAPGTIPKPIESPKPAPDPLSPVADSFASTGSAKTGNLQVQLQDRGVVISVLASVLFVGGSADLKPEATQLLNDMAAGLNQGTESVLVEGSPDAGDSTAPWDLASRRAGAVVNFLVTGHGFDPQRFVVIGYGKGSEPQGVVNVIVLRRK